MAKYRAYLHGQVREPLTGYGKLDYIFFDFSYSRTFTPKYGGARGATWGLEELLPTVGELQPGIVVNDRLGLPGDVRTPERYQPAGAYAPEPGQSLWEGEQTLNGSGGYEGTTRSGSRLSYWSRCSWTAYRRTATFFERGADCPRRIRRPALGTLARSVHGCGGTVNRSTVWPRLIHPSRTAVTQRGETDCSSTFSRGRSAMCTCPGWQPGRFRPLPPRRIRSTAREVDPSEGRARSRWGPAGGNPKPAPTGTPTKVLVPVVELFLRANGATAPASRPISPP